MNRDVMEGNWEQLKWSLQQRWIRLSHDDLEAIRRDPSAIAGRVQERYGLNRKEALQEVSAWNDQTIHPKAA